MKDVKSCQCNSEIMTLRLGAEYNQDAAFVFDFADLHRFLELKKYNSRHCSLEMLIEEANFKQKNGLYPIVWNRTGDKNVPTFTV